MKGLKGEYMATKFIGFKRKNGTFTNDKTGEVVAYDNYDLFFITGNVPDIVGYYPSDYKIKGNVIRQVVGLDSSAGDSDVLSLLHDMINNEVLLNVLNVDDKPVVTGLALVPHVQNSNKVNSK